MNSRFKILDKEHIDRTQDSLKERLCAFKLSIMFGYAEVRGEFHRPKIRCQEVKMFLDIAVYTWDWGSHIPVSLKIKIYLYVPYHTVKCIDLVTVSLCSKNI